MNYKSKLELALDAVKEAGNLIMNIYNHAVKVEYKVDELPFLAACSPNSFNDFVL